MICNDHTYYKFAIIHYYKIWANRIEYLIHKGINIEPILEMVDFSKEKEEFWHKNKGY